MSGKKGVKHFGEHIINNVLKMKAEGKTNREISEFYEFENKKNAFSWDCATQKGTATKKLCCDRG